ncbi:hypothetical protein PRIPAC_75840 [Pristionchus pacificus]|uniref:Uncharacterized protein n=1 Tax=Pristionchus pacificus TaxID=54126 RepID=A0A2A6CGE3_PRIPA|nr:hypothetical protein PRIPAC_75840 [Pristionchus pacificus]|eukprot:PDM77284.1 hypothetical protein PRIPAC_43196 [Pristionchus pacificus]
MIIQLMFLLAASSWAQFDIEKCEDDKACLYHYRCSERSPNGTELVLATTTPEARTIWEDENCEASLSITTLSVRPINIRVWNVTIKSTIPHVGIKFGDSLTILTNQTDASFKDDSDIPMKFPLTKAGKHLFNLEVTSKHEKLHDIFSLKSVFYIEKTMEHGSTSSMQPIFWKKILELSTIRYLSGIKCPTFFISAPCDASLIVDDCTNSVANCTALTQDKDSAKCLSNDIMWLKARKSSWQEIRTISCDENKEWKLTNQNGTEIVQNETMRIRCAAEEPELWNAANTILNAFILPFSLYFIM